MRKLIVRICLRAVASAGVSGVVEEARSSSLRLKASPDRGIAERQGARMARDMVRQ